MQETHKKILFKYYSDYLEETVSETMWAEIVDLEKGLFKLDNIPFFGPLIATDDLFYAEFDEDEKRLVYKETIENSGNSIVQVIILEKGFDKEIIREKLKVINCLSEGLNDSFISVEVVRDVDYSIVRSILNEYEANDTIQYAEPCLSDKHRADLLKN
ncbi:DUF4265 domain-containing protein [Flavobacterium johnsoniae]|jgi:hypothetical protein|uniref:DUF4265 domain-containing protein n=1 Tax=Flavobacterium johnsoniae (strain ATCC 17061 / DSM 2064 / JCM 8514 / BCRC 14874 / CCUG 350202 / NBRC 14942 / NCIMB 11054 / UW101) TaxID=376686 RepID=A5FG10_FLAJ1|nr:DUF4265 domain-containing protein [Flavobacterium johnsoniae]ABQ05857.1 hypothetical protein Fjoh_2835 [Flavobacterium johnsoniae UW101]OXG01096.1 hypothetical protein B0A63_06225 [Flavobacterium johnsoniae UW101]WQG81593.1 DUF4265 domain-containing protein [Flavobacterium johnsoniae UW101]SHK58146.1 protein of unknown function [Flavobacterium johnsoniae]